MNVLIANSKKLPIFGFTIALLCLAVFAMIIIDIGNALTQYFYLREAVRSGAQKVMSLPSLAADIEYGNAETQNCIQAKDHIHSQIHNRVLEFVKLHSPSLYDICVTSMLISSSKVVKVQANAKFNALFPLFNLFTIKASTFTPYPYKSEKERRNNEEK